MVYTTVLHWNMLEGHVYTILNVLSQNEKAFLEDIAEAISTCASGFRTIFKAWETCLFLLKGPELVQV